MLFVNFKKLNRTWPSPIYQVLALPAGVEVSKLLLWYGKYLTNSIYQVVVKTAGVEISKLLLWYVKYLTSFIYQVVVKSAGVEVSKLLLWYGKDFGNSDKEVLQWIQQGKNFKLNIYLNWELLNGIYP